MLDMIKNFKEERRVPEKYKHLPAKEIYKLMTEEVLNFQDIYGEKYDYKEDLENINKNYDMNFSKI